MRGTRARDFQGEVNPLLLVSIMKFWKKAVLCILLIEVVGNASGLISFISLKDWYAMLERPPGTPPNGVFGPIWTILFAMMGYALAVVLSADPGKERKQALRWFSIQFLFNLAWTPVFFGLHRIDAALVIIALLLVAVVVVVGKFLRVSRLAGWLLVPYLLWVGYASYLNAGFWWLNRF